MADRDPERAENQNDLVEKTKKFLCDGCGCSHGAKGGPCSKELQEETVLFNLNNCLELTTAELDLVVLANIQAFTRSETIGTKRNRSPRSNFQFQSSCICKEMFLHLYGLSYSRFRRLKEHYEQHGIFLHTHGNSKKLPSNTHPLAVTENVHVFLTNYVEENAIVLPGRIPGFKRDDVKVLSSSETKMSVWRAYISTCESSGQQAVCYSKFTELWQKFHPDVVMAKPMTDLCLTCQENTTKLLRAANLSDQEKSDCVNAQQDHLNHAQEEREHYRGACSDSATTFKALETEIALNEPHAACSMQGTMHYSFDYAQQVHIPSNPLQPGPIYFKTPRKCGIFGVICEAIPRQVNYLVDEATTAGKGANATISYVHHFLAQHGLGETHVHFHADNCAGQNKNNYFLWYFAWRIASKLHHNIKYSFLIAGHTKFGPDRCFGMLKKAYKVNFISSIYEFARMVDKSSSTGVNKAQLTGTHDGHVIVPVYDWSSFLGQYFNKIINIKKYHHFRFSKNEPGIVYCKENAGSPEEAVVLLKNQAVILPPTVLPSKITPEGLSEDRKRYLYREIRQFCRIGTEDLVAPAP